MNLSKKSAVCVALAAMLVALAGCGSNKGAELVKLPLSTEKVSVQVTSSTEDAPAVTTNTGDGALVIIDTTDTVIVDPDVIPETPTTEPENLLPANPLGEIVSDNVAELDLGAALAGCAAITTLPTYTIQVDETMSMNGQSQSGTMITSKSADGSVGYKLDLLANIHFYKDATGNTVFFDDARKVVVSPYTLDVSANLDTDNLAGNLTSYPTEATIVDINGEQLYRFTVATTEGNQVYVYMLSNGLLKYTYTVSPYGVILLGAFTFTTDASPAVFDIPADYTPVSMDSYNALLSGGAAPVAPADTPTNDSPAETTAGGSDFFNVASTSGANAPLF